MTGWILEPCSERSRTPRFQCLLLEAGQVPEWCEGDVLISPGGLWMPAIGQAPDDWRGGSEFSSWPILEGGVLTKYCLSPAQCSHFLALAQRAGCPPPKEIEALLLKQGGVYPSSVPFSSTGCGEQPSTGSTRSSAAALDGQQTLFQMGIRDRLKALFKDSWEGIIGNADAFLYLGGNEQSTHKYVSELLGKETILTQSISQSKGRSGSYSKSTQLIGRDLMTPDEVRMLDNRLSILLVRGEKPVIDEKYELMRHPNIHETEYGGAAPYVHHATCIYAVDDLPFTFETLNEIEVLELEESL